MKALFQGRRADRLRSACLRLGILSAILAPVSASADERSQHLANMKAIASSIRVFSSAERNKEAVIVPVRAALLRQYSGIAGVFIVDLGVSRTAISDRGDRVLHN